MHPDTPTPPAREPEGPDFEAARALAGRWASTPDETGYSGSRNLARAHLALLARERGPAEGEEDTCTDCRNRWSVLTIAGDIGLCPDCAERRLNDQLAALRASLPREGEAAEVEGPLALWSQRVASAVFVARTACRGKGYALGVHGTLRRDIDVIAVPWTEEVATPREVAHHVLERLTNAGHAVGWGDGGEEGNARGNGRHSWAIVLSGTPFLYLDLSVIAPAAPPLPAGRPEGDRAKLLRAVLVPIVNDAYRRGRSEKEWSAEPFVDAILRAVDEFGAALPAGRGSEVSERQMNALWDEANAHPDARRRGPWIVYGELLLGRGREGAV